MFVYVCVLPYAFYEGGKTGQISKKPPSPQYRLCEFSLTSCPLQVTVDGTDRLPTWLSYSPTKRQLFGVPTNSDVTTSSLNIKFTPKPKRHHGNNNNNVHNWVGETRTVKINVLGNREPFTCGGGRSGSNGVQSSMNALMMQPVTTGE